MSRKVLLETGYTFTPGESGVGSLIIPKAILRERLILITNVTTNTVIYNFSDANLKATTYTSSSSANTTTLVFNSITSGMSSTDKLQIIVDEYDEKFTPSETYVDPVNKFRVSTAQALIDTDFEYGTQISKWENLSTINSRPFSFASATGLGVTGITLSTSSRTVTSFLPSGAPSVGTPIAVQDCYLNIANGNFIVETSNGSTQFTYTARAVNTSTVTDIFDPNKTVIYSGSIYTGSAIGGTPTITSSGTAVTITTTIPHGLAIGNEVAITGTSAATSNPPNGSFVVATINSATQFVIYTQTAPVGAISSGTIYVRPQGQVLHRPFDGGVIFSSNANGNYESTTRQTRRYFRYQSGKGIQVSSGTIIKPNLQIDSLTSSGTTVTIQTKEQHNILPGVPGTVVTISGANESAYNGSFAITSVTGYNTFQYTALSAPSATTASGSYSASVTGWYGASNRLGIFDAQNGIFFEFDGQTLYAVRRSSTYQISGKVTATNGSSVISRTDNSFPTSFTKQLNMGDFIVIRGQSYRVVDIASDSSLTISPAYRGATTSFAIVSRTVELRIPQSQWNIDKCDGTGPSGYNIDLSKMQMFYMDYSWYGAGFIRWGFRGLDGNVFYAHKLANNNVNTEAYMRSGNLPARYESTSEPPKTQLSATLASGGTAVSVASTVGFPTAGTILVRNANLYEYMNYTGISGSGTNGTFTGLTRGRAGVTGLTITINAGSNTGTATTTGIQIGQRVVNTNAFPEGTFVTTIGTGTLTFSQAALSANPTGVTIAPMGATSGQNFTYSAGDPVAIELAYPTYGPTISHWGTSVIMDGRFDDDKSLVFTFGQRSSTTVGAGATAALFSIRVSPSVDNGVSAAFGARELINRMQLTLRALDITTTNFSANLLVTAVLNGTPSSSTNWTNAVANASGVVNSSLAQIASYAGGSTTVSGGEVTAGFFVGSGANSIDLSQVRDLGNSILGGGGTTSNTQIYPDGPDTLTIVVTNLSGSSANVFGRLSWTEAQA